jgi:hypothetical protein
VYKQVTSDNNNPMGGEHHRNNQKPRERTSNDEDWGDGFLTLFDSSLKKCHYSTYMGGDNLEYMDDILFDGKDVIIAGISYSYDFPRITTKKKEPWSRGFAVRFNWKKNK